MCKVGLFQISKSYQNTQDSLISFVVYVDGLVWVSKFPHHFYLLSFLLLDTSVNSISNENSIPLASNSSIAGLSSCSAVKMCSQFGFPLARTDTILAKIFGVDFVSTLSIYERIRHIWPILSTGVLLNFSFAFTIFISICSLRRQKLNFRFSFKTKSSKSFWRESYLNSFNHVIHADILIGRYAKRVRLFQELSGPTSARETTVERKN